MDPFDMNLNNYSSSEQQEDIFMELDDDASDARYDAYNGEESGSLATVVDANVGYEYLHSQPCTSGNNGRKRKSQSTYPFAKKVSRSVWKVQHQPLDVSVQKSDLLKTNADATTFTNVGTVPDAKNFKDETTFIQRLVKREDQSGMLLSNDGRDNSKANISSAFTFFEVKVSEEEQKQYIAKQRYSCSYVDYSKKGIIKCDKCGKSFSQLNLFKQHRKRFDS